MCMTTRKRWSWVVYATGEEMIESNGGGEGGCGDRAGFGGDGGGFASCGIIKAGLSVELSWHRNAALPPSTIRKSSVFP